MTRLAFIVGAVKAATTSVHASLAMHPDICGSVPKETGYFLPVRYGREPDPIQAFLRNFPGDHHESVLLEATPGYLMGGERVAVATRAASQELFGTDAKAIAGLRDPVTRALSFYTFMLSRLHVPADTRIDDYMRRCIEVADDAEHDEHLVHHRAVSGGLYVEAVTEWIDQYGDDFTFYFFEDFAKDPASVLSSLHHHLDVPDTPPPASMHYNKGGFRPQNRQLQRTALWIDKQARPVLDRFPGARQKARDLYQRFNNSKPDSQESSGAPAATRAMLEEYFADQNKGLGSLLLQRHPGVLLPAWCPS